MGYMKHNAVVVTGLDRSAMTIIHENAKRIFKEKFNNDIIVKDGSILVSDLLDGITNSQLSFIIVPDGSKEGWNDSDKAQEARDEFMDWCVKSGHHCDYIEVRA